MEKRRKIFDDGSTVVEEVSVRNKKKPELNVNVDKPINNRSTEKKTIQVVDVLDTFAGYLPTQANFMPRDGGECLLCGKETTSSMRKICFDCLQKKGQEIFKKAKKSVEVGDKDFQI